MKHFLEYEFTQSMLLQCWELKYRFIAEKKIVNNPVYR